MQQSVELLLLLLLRNLLYCSLELIATYSHPQHAGSRSFVRSKTRSINNFYILIDMRAPL